VGRDMGGVILLLNHVGNPSDYPTTECKGDVNCNDKINIGDVILLLNHVGDPDKYKLGCCGN